MPIARVALDVPLHRLFDYLVDESDGPENPALQPGLRVRVPFGHGEKIGIVVEVTDHSALSPEQLKPVLEILNEPPLPADFFRFAVIKKRVFYV